VFSQANNGPFASTGTQGNVGAAILEKFQVILDYKQNRIILEPNTQFNKPITYNSSGLFLVSFGPNYATFKIEAIADNSPASEAGLHKGDILIAIDGRPVTEYTLSRLRSMFQDAKQCELTIERGQEHLRLTLKPRGLI
jgi:predicted metalloprotease with PDZ domain